MNFFSSWFAKKESEPVFKIPKILTVDDLEIIRAKHISENFEYVLMQLNSKLASAARDGNNSVTVYPIQGAYFPSDWVDDLVIALQTYLLEVDKKYFVKKDKVSQYDCSFYVSIGWNKQKTITGSKG